MLMQLKRLGKDAGINTQSKACAASNELFRYPLAMEPASNVSFKLRIILQLDQNSVARVGQPVVKV